MAVEADVEPELGADDGDLPEGSIEGQAADAERASAQAQLTIEGTNDELSLHAGGDSPTASTAKLRGRSLPLEGEFDKGEVVTLLVTCRIGEVHLVDHADPFGQVKNTERRHVLVPTQVRRLQDAPASE